MIFKDLVSFIRIINHIFRYPVEYNSFFRLFLKLQSVKIYKKIKKRLFIQYKPKPDIYNYSFQNYTN